MSSAGLLKLIHSGLQDERLLPPKGKPLPFTPPATKGGRFTTELYRVDFDNRPAFGTTAKATLPRRGHLITKAFLVTVMPDIQAAQLRARAACDASGVAFAGPTFGWTNSIGHALLQSASITIGANAIDTIDQKLFEILDEFHTPLEKMTVVDRLLGRYDNGFKPGSNGLSTPNQTVITPLPFWFNRGDPSAALPIDAIGTDAVQISVTFNNVNNLWVSTSRSTNSQGQQTMPALLNSPFYYVNPTSGVPIAGLQGNPAVSQLASLVPGITMPDTLQINDSYLLLEYVYVDGPEANRIRLANLDYPIVNHYTITPFITNFATQARITMRIPNPVRDLYVMIHRTDADLLNAPFLATRDLSGLFVADASGVGPIAPWWPDASGLNLNTSILQPLIPAFTETDSEPITSLALHYEGRLVRYATDAPAFFRSILPTFEKRKTPWVNKYLYHLPFGTQSEFVGITNPMGHANLDKIQTLELSMNFKPFRGSLKSTDVPNYTVYVYAESYNILKVYGGRAGLMFQYSQTSNPVPVTVPTAPSLGTAPQTCA